jgi:hypothetical protein
MADAGPMHRPFAVTIGWTKSGDCVGLVHRARNDTTFVYSTSHLLRNTNPGIVRLTDLTFDLPNKFEASQEAIGRFGELMFGGRSGDGRPAGARDRRSVDG